MTENEIEKIDKELRKLCRGGCGMHPSKCLCEDFLQQRPNSDSWREKKDPNRRKSFIKRILE